MVSLRWTVKDSSRQNVVGAGQRWGFRAGFRFSPLSGGSLDFAYDRFEGDGVDAPRRHRCAIMEVFEHHQ